MDTVSAGALFFQRSGQGRGTHGVERRQLPLRFRSCGRAPSLCEKDVSGDGSTVVGRPFFRRNPATGQLRPLLGVEIEVGPTDQPEGLLLEPQFEGEPERGLDAADIEEQPVGFRRRGAGGNQPRFRRIELEPSLQPPAEPGPQRLDAGRSGEGEGALFR